ncbi:Crp-like helix-turn-helix domain protein [compost metagenome]
MALESYALQTLEQRLANRLLMLAASHGRETAAGLELDLHLPQDALARLIGATRQRVNQILKDWEQEGLISHGQGGRVCLPAPGKLEALATL